MENGNFFVILKKKSFLKKKKKPFIIQFAQATVLSKLQGKKSYLFGMIQTNLQPYW